MAASGPSPPRRPRTQSPPNGDWHAHVSTTRHAPLHTPLPHRASPSPRRHAMPVRRPGPIRPRRLFLVGLLLTAFALLPASLTAPASAAEAPEAPEAGATTTATPARGSAHMGMGVVAHDG